MYIIIFDSTNVAIKAETLLLRNGFNVKVMPVSSKVRAGCGICLRLDSLDELERAALILNENNIQNVDYYKVQDEQYQMLSLI